MCGFRCVVGPPSGILGGPWPPRQRLHQTPRAASPTLRLISLVVADYSSTGGGDAVRDVACLADDRADLADSLDRALAAALNGLDLPLPRSRV